MNGSEARAEQSSENYLSLFLGINESEGLYSAVSVLLVQSLTLSLWRFPSKRRVRGAMTLNTQTKGEKGMTRKSLTYSLFAVFILGFAAVVPMGHTEDTANQVTIIRDNYGVPHIFASTKEGLAFGTGYAMAQDRLWQADVFRRSSFGSLAEFGLATIQQDYETRSLGYSREELGDMFDNWMPTNPQAHLKEMWSAYVDGINLYIYQALTAAAYGDYSLMPAEYLAFGLPLEPFSIEDCAAITVMMAWRFGGTGGDELSYAAAHQALQEKHGPLQGWLIFNDLFPQNDPGAEVTIPGIGSWYPLGNMPETGQLCNIDDIYQKYEETRMGQDQLLESLGIPTKFGSNAWMVNSRLSRTGNAFQVGGPQMGQSIPQIVLEVGLHGAGINAVGMMMPQAPSILIGVNEYGAWTSTTGASDVMDTYIEVLNPSDPTEYLYEGAWLPMEKRTERIYGYKKLTYQDKEVYRTIHGPIIAWDLANNLAFTMKTPFYKNELQAEEGWSLFQQASNIWEFQEAVKTIQPSHNFYWIDRLGNIGYWHAGTFPIKPAIGKYGPIDDRLPLWGTGEEEWVGVTGFNEMPRSINPEQGWLANWNNKPIADWPYAESDVDWGEGHRVKRIMDLLAAGDKFSFGHMNRINMDAGYNHVAGMNFLGYVTEAAKLDPTVPRQAVSYLQAWNYHYNDVNEPRWSDTAATYDDPGLTIFDAWYSEIFDEVFADDLPPGVMAWPSTLVHVFDGPESKLLLNYDYLNGEDRNTVIVRVLKAVLADLTTKFGTGDMSKWLTPVRKVIFSQMGALPAPTMHYMNRGTYNHIAEMPLSQSRRPPHAVDVIPPGQSGFVKLEIIGGVPTPIPSPHAYDQLPLYETWQYKQMLFRIDGILEVAESTITLSYP